MTTDVGRSPDGSGYSPSGLSQSPLSQAEPSIPNAASVLAQLNYPAAVEALAKAIGPLIVEEFDGEPYGTKWDAIREKDRISIRFIALRGLSRLVTHCHTSASAASAIEAQRAATTQIGSTEGESAVAESQTPDSSGDRV